MKPNIHVTPNPEGGWIVRRGDGGEPLSTHEVKPDAMKAARKVAMEDKVDRVEHGRDGRIKDRDSYGNDPRRRPG